LFFLFFASFLLQYWIMSNPLPETIVLVNLSLNANSSRPAEELLLRHSSLQAWQIARILLVNLARWNHRSLLTDVSDRTKVLFQQVRLGDSQYVRLMIGFIQIDAF
jgi:hypothetical protein